VQLLLGPTKLESTTRYLGVEVDALLPYQNWSTCDLGGVAGLDIRWPFRLHLLMLNIANHRHCWGC
jgi:hypothetical protein